METEIVYLSILQTINGRPEITMAKVEGTHYQEAYEKCQKQIKALLEIKPRMTAADSEPQFPFMSEDVGI